MLQWSQDDSPNYPLWSLTGYLKQRLNIFPCPCPTCPPRTDRVCFKGLDTQWNKKSCISYHCSLACWCSLKFYLLHLWLNCNYCHINWVYRKNVFLGSQASNFLFFLTIIGLVTQTENSFDWYTKVGPAELWSFSQWSMGWQGCNQWCCSRFGSNPVEYFLLLFFSVDGFIGKALQHNIELNP